MNRFQNFFWNTKKRIIHKYTHYLDIYDKYFSKFYDKPVRIVEVGIGHGGSLQMWKECFGLQAEIHGIDVVDRKTIEEDQITIWQGNQSDDFFWEEFFSRVPEVDIFIDDGSHYSFDQIHTLKKIFSHISQGGIYLCEDLHTAYLQDFAGGFRSPDSFIEYSKGLVDTINSYVIPEIKESVEQFDNVRSISFYTGVVIIEKNDVSTTGECLFMGEEKA